LHGVVFAFFVPALPYTGIGAAGTAALGIYLFQEPATVLRLGSMALIIAGIAGLKLAS
jgi:quaternary ammonium compound-resistance protein SugE